MTLLSLRAWLKPGRRLTDCIKRFWACLGWAWQIVVLGIVILAALIVLPRLVPAAWRPSIRTAGFAIFFGAALATGLPKIKNIHDPSTRMGLYAAWGSIASGALLAIPAMTFISVPHWARIAGTVGAVFFLFAFPAFGVVSVLADAITVTGPGTVFTILAMLGISIFLFPPLIICLMTNGQWPKPYILGPPQANSGWVDLISLGPPAALFVAPDIFHKILPWDGAKEVTKRLLPNWLAGIALILTSGYALALHFASAVPLATFPLTGLILAFLFVGVVLWPLYKLIISSCWRLGIAEAIQLKSWRNDQQEMLHEVLVVLRRIWNAQVKAEEHPVGNAESNQRTDNRGGDVGTDHSPESEIPRKKDGTTTSS